MNLGSILVILPSLTKEVSFIIMKRRALSANLSPCAGALSKSFKGEEVNGASLKARERE